MAIVNGPGEFPERIKNHIGNEELSQSQKANMMFRDLESHVNELVTCAYWLNGQKISRQFSLVEVIPYISIKVTSDKYGETTIIPFIGNETAIISILLVGKSSPIYENPYVKLGYDASTKEEIQKYRTLMYGTEIVKLIDSREETIIDESMPSTGTIKF